MKKTGALFGKTKSAMGSSSRRSLDDTSLIPFIELMPSQDLNDPMEEDDDDVPPPTLVIELSLDLREAREKQAYNHLRNNILPHTWAFDMNLLERTGMGVEFDSD